MKVYKEGVLCFDDLTEDEFAEEIQAAIDEISSGEFYSLEEVELEMKKLNI